MKIVSLEFKNMDDWFFFSFSFLAFWSILGCIQCCLFTCRWWVQNEETPSHISHLPFVHLLPVSVYWSLNWPQDLIGSLLGHLQSTVERYTAEIFHEDRGVCIFFLFYFLLPCLKSYMLSGIEVYRRVVYLTASIIVVHNKKLHLLLWKPCLQRSLCRRNLEPWFLHNYKPQKENKNENFIL